MTQTISLESLGIHAPVPEKTEVDYKFCGEVSDLYVWRLKNTLKNGITKAIWNYLSEREERSKTT